MKDVTPKQLRCNYGESCPAILEVTPDNMKCSVTDACPAVFEREDGHFIIGKRVATPPEALAGRIGPDETVVWVPKGLVRPDDRT